MALFCVGTASAFGWLLAFYQIPEALLSGVKGWGMGPIATGFFISGVFLLVGCFLDAIPAIIIVGAMLAAGLTEGLIGQVMGTIAVILAAVNVFGGFLVTQRMLEMFRKKEPKAVAKPAAALAHEGAK